jgi:hypothetical protein
VVDLAAGAAAVVDFADTRTAVVRGTVFADADGNGRAGPGDAGRAGVTVFLDADRDGSADAGEPTAVTDADGRYAFVVSGGTYRVGAALSAGWSARAGGLATVKVRPGRAAVRDLAHRPTGGSEAAALGSLVSLVPGS